MNILYDLSSAQPQGHISVNGGGEYSLSLLIELLDHFNSLSAQINIDILLNDKKGKNKKAFDVLESYHIKYYSFNSHKDISLLANKYDMLFLPIMYPDYENLKINDNVVVIGLIHDLSSFYHYYLKNNYGEFINDDCLNPIRNLRKKIHRNKKMLIEKQKHENLFKINNNTHVYTVSHYTENAILYFLDNCKVENVFYTIMKKTITSNKNENEILNYYGLESDNFILLSNCSRWAKNNIRAIEAIDEFLSKYQNVNNYYRKKIVLLGCNDKVITYFKKKLKNIDNFMFLGFVDDDTMECFYKNAFLFVYPSILEGFGLPPVEAMKYDTISICSTSTSIPEVCGNAVIYFDPYDKDSIKIALLKAFNKEIRTQKQLLINKQLNYLEEKQHNDTLSLIEKLLAFSK